MFQSPEEPDTNKSETDNGNATDVSIGDQDASGKQSSGADSYVKEERKSKRGEGSKDRSHRD